MDRDTTDRLAHQTRRLRDLVDEKGALWEDEGGRTTLHRYLRPHAEAAEELVAALRERDDLLGAFEAEMAIVEREVEVAASARLRAEAAVARPKDDIESADEQVAEMFRAEADAADLEAKAVRLADLANDCPGECGPPAKRTALDCSAREDWLLPQRTRRSTQLSQLQKMFPTVGVVHVLEGEFNSKKKFTGFHGLRSNIGRVLVKEKPDCVGVYRAVVAGYSENEDLVIKYTSKHTMFPDHWSEGRICRELLSAHSRLPENQKQAKNWKAISPSGIPILGHVREDGSIIGYPVRRDMSHDR